MIPINYQLLGKASQHYERLNYKYVEVSWYASDEASLLTLPPDRRLCFTLMGEDISKEPLVGSAEQSFIDMMLSGQLPPGTYQTITPCWRDEEVNELHRQYFMKLELINVLEPNTPNEKRDRELRFMIWEAAKFFGKYLEVHVVGQEDRSLDLVSKHKGYELGSYGIRTYKRHTWVYGTGLAEPRFSTVIGLVK